MNDTPVNPDTLTPATQQGTIKEASPVKNGDIVKIIEILSLPTRFTYGNNDQSLLNSYLQFLCVDKQAKNSYFQDQTGKVVTSYNNILKYELASNEEHEKFWESHSKSDTKYFKIYLGCQTGSDPEIFVINKKDDVVIPAFNFLPDKNSGDSLFYDGFQAEFNVKPSHCHSYVIDSVQEYMQRLYNKAVKYNSNAKLSCQPVVNIPQQMMESITDEQAALGCAPSTNIYMDVEPLRVQDPKQLSIRFAGCHIHFGVGKLHDIDTYMMIKSLDAILGPIMVSLLDGLENPARRQFYGMAGEFREPPHGVEYRVPSSAILCHPAVTHLVFDIGRFVSRMSLMRQFTDQWKYDENRVRSIINNLDINDARLLIAENQTLFEAMLSIIYSNSSSFLRAKTLILKGAKNYLNTDDLKANWKINAVGSEAWRSHSDGTNESIINLKTMKAWG